ncbi:MAG: AmmeMemoRadiSam system radical SAM enzyme [Euryarchaeota archaeon]|nr:AmmeMemoRadiSam system radical SAM enzyme [Euryarchaeota archaeon]
MRSLVECRFWEQAEKESVRCNLCPHRCLIPPNGVGACRVRKNINGKLYTLVYGLASSIAVDPIEKKPFYHFEPGSHVLSLSTWGCNLRCPHCQNWEISQTEPLEHFSRKISPEDVVRYLKETQADGISWTYNEPTIWYEFIYDASKLVREETDAYITWVTNGFINEAPLRKIAPYVDGMNVDYKGPEEAYKLFGGRLDPVKRTITLAYDLGIHVELTYLIIPTVNDSNRSIEEFIEFVKSLDPEIPVHFTRFFPHYKMRHLPPTPIETLIKAYETAKEKGLKYVYVGNIIDETYNTTYCPGCGRPVIRRSVLAITQYDVIDGRCKYCGHPIRIWSRKTLR